MNVLNSFLLLLLFSGCQKEIIYPDNPESMGVKEELPQEAIYRAEPKQELRLSEFAPMLWEKKQYIVTEYYCVKKDLWGDFPLWLKDDRYVFDESGNAQIEGRLNQSPSKSFETMQTVWQLYVQDNEMTLDWVDENYGPKTYSVVAYDTGKSFTLCSKANDYKVFLTYTLLR